MKVMDGPTCVARFRAIESTYLREHRQQQMSNLEQQLEHALSDNNTTDGDDVAATAAASTGSCQTSEKDDRQRVKPKALSRGGVPGLYRLPIVGMSANSDNESRLMGLASGMDDFIAKPFSMKDLEAMLNNLYPPSA